jgi:hypothetical protein
MYLSIYLFVYNFEILKIWWMFAKKVALLVEITLEK